MREVGRLAAFRGAVLTVQRGSILAEGGSSVLAEVVRDRPVLVFMSPTIARLHGAAFHRVLADLAVPKEAMIVIATGERNKNLVTVESMIDAAEGVRFSRRGVFIGIGGGVVLDTVGLAASLFRRGVSHIKVGTTLLAQVDAAVSVKCGVNVKDSKNLVGSFYPPEVAIADGTFLRTVPQRHVRCGLAEMIKLAVISDGVLFEALERQSHRLLVGDRDDDVCRWLVDRSIKAMLAELEPNVFEADLRRRVDFGHTISPHLEAETRYAVHHGEAVAIDVVYFCVLSCLLGHLSDEALLRVVDLLKRLGIPTSHDYLDNPHFLNDALTSTQAHRGMRLHLPIPTEIGSAVFVDDRRDVPDTVLSEAARIARKL